MVDAKGEAGNLGAQPGLQGVAGIGQAGSITVGQEATATIRDHVLHAEAATYNVNTFMAATLTVTRAPFSLPGMTERFGEDPEFYRRLAEFVASEVQRELARHNGTGNSHEVIRGEFVRIYEGLTKVSTYLKAGKAGAEAAANTVIELRDGFSAWCDAHPELIDSILKLSVISLFCYVLHQFGGATGDTAAFIAYAVVNKEKLAELLSGKKKE